MSACASMHSGRSHCPNCSVASNRYRRTRARGQEFRHTADGPTTLSVPTSVISCWFIYSMLLLRRTCCLVRSSALKLTRFTSPGPDGRRRNGRHSEGQETGNSTPTNGENQPEQIGVGVSHGPLPDHGTAAPWPMSAAGTKRFLWRVTPIPSTTTKHTPGTHISGKFPTRKHKEHRPTQLLPLFQVLYEKKKTIFVNANRVYRPLPPPTASGTKDDGGIQSGCSGQGFSCLLGLSSSSNCIEVLFLILMFDVKNSELDSSTQGGPDRL